MFHHFPNSIQSAFLLFNSESNSSIIHDACPRYLYQWDYLLGSTSNFMSKSGQRTFSIGGEGDGKPLQYPGKENPKWSHKKLDTTEMTDQQQNNFCKCIQHVLYNIGICMYVYIDIYTHTYGGARIHF